MIECKLLKANTRIVALALVTMVVVGGFGVELAYAESSSANASVTVSNTISLTLTGGDLVIDNLTPGNASDSNVITASVTSNSPYGFHLSATTGTSGGTTSLVNTADSNFTFTNLNSNKTILADFSDNTWGYSYSADGTNWISGDYGAGATAGYNGLPLDGNDDGDSGVVLFNSDNYLGSKSVQFKIGAKSATTQAAGTYTNTVNFYAVTNPEPPKTIATATTMQEVAPGVDGCPGTLVTGQVYTLTDSRDNTEYHVAKLADGKCWMLDNLALDLTDGVVQGNLTSATTNATDISLNYLKGITSRDASTDPSGKYATSGVTSNWPSWSYGTDTNFSIPRINMQSKELVGDSAEQYGNGSHKYGGYYNYCAVSAGSYCYGESSGTGNASEDICPKGWRMPTGGSINTSVQPNLGEYQTIKNYYNSTTVATNSNSLQYSLSTPLAGFFDYGVVGGQGERAVIWASTRYDNYNMYNIYLASSYINPTSTYSREYGYSARCLLDS